MPMSAGTPNSTAPLCYVTGPRISNRFRHIEGTTPGWPISYEDLEPFYQKAEQLYRVRGAIGYDPTEPLHSGSYAFPPVPDEPFVADLKRRLRAQGLHPGPLPLGVNLDRWLARGKTTWDAFPDTCSGKMDAETAALSEALQHPNVTLMTGTKVTRLIADIGAWRSRDRAKGHMKGSPPA